MGETGIGKTSLIVLLSNIMKQNMRILNIHAGVTGEEICEFVLKAQSDIRESINK
jgi:midasin (ATPase involved in ribosome maturation)